MCVRMTCHWSVLVLILCLCNSHALQFNKDGYFKIVQFTDLHFGSNNGAMDAKTPVAQKAILDAERPDLVIISATEYPNERGGSCMSLLRGSLHCWRDSVKVLADLNIPWAMTFGNHDRCSKWPGFKLLEEDMKFTQSLTMTGQTSPNGTSGDSNYVLHVNGTVSKGLDLWFFDTREEGCQGHSGYGCVDDTQIAWYQQESKRRLATDEGSPYGLVTIHIPPPEIMYLANLDINTTSVYGVENEKVCCPLYNSGFVDAVADVGNAQWMIFGHDHDNDFMGVYRNVTLAYGRKTGFSSYGPSSPLVVGARVLYYHETTQGVDVSSWIRDYDGTKEIQTHIPHTFPYQDECY